MSPFFDALNPPVFTCVYLVCVPYIVIFDRFTGSRCFNEFNHPGQRPCDASPMAGGAKGSQGPILTDTWNEMGPEEFIHNPINHRVASYVSQNAFKTIHSVSPKNEPMFALMIFVV